MKLSRGDNAGRQWDHDYASCSNSLADLHRRIRSWIRNACLALTQAPRAPLDVFAVYCRIARHHVRARPSRILSLPPDIEARCSGGRWCVCGRGGTKVVEILQAKLLGGHRASFIRSTGGLFVVGASGRERTIPGTRFHDAWRLLSTHQARAEDRFEHLNDRHRRREK
jgi:hypothetical protein